MTEPVDSPSRRAEAGRCRPTPPPQDPEVRKARDILRGKAATPEEMKDLADRLKDEKKFGLARKLLDRAWKLGTSDPKLSTKIRQKLTLCTYKDPDLPLAQRLTKALEVLERGEDLATTTDQETLGLAGAIYKRRWEMDAQKLNLERALSHYMRGYRVGPKTDQGYTGINAAYVLDVLSRLEAAEALEAGDRSQIAEERAAQAREIRKDLVRVLPKLLEDEKNAWLKTKWWFYATLAEAHFGLRDYDAARQRIEEGKKRCHNPPNQVIPEWELHSTAFQLASIAHIQSSDRGTAEDLAQSAAGSVLEALGTRDEEGQQRVGRRYVAARTAFIGKVGLSLSGGGFRASLFHIGVLARLAELDVLRHVEVLSCVSGGSILGAYYYLELKRLLEEKPDAEITRENYIELVKRVEQQFLEGVQKNIRMRVAASFITNLKMIFLPGYSRTLRAGELYEHHLYSRVCDGNGRRPRWLTDLHIKPPGEAEQFAPKNDNWRRQAKVPELILNATTLNTGHNWQFTASWMGEPPASINPEVDANCRLRRMYYWEAPEKHRCIRLGHAVGASACVPGFFEPLPLAGLYADRTIRLVDGGVHDNQGLVGLLASDCSVVLVSDASGQMDAIDEPSDGTIPVLLRATAIFGSRVRAEQFDELMSRKRAGTLRSVMLVHLMQDLEEDPVDWIQCQDPFDASDAARPSYLRGPLTRYGVRKDVQRLIARIRTDLDSFSDAEAFALMASGYRMTDHAFAQEPSLRRIPVHSGAREAWRFVGVEDALRDREQAQWLLRILDVASRRTFKVWHLMPQLKVLAAVLAVTGLGAASWLAWSFREEQLLVVDVQDVAITVLVVILGAVVGKWVVRLVRLRSTLRKAAIGFALLLGWLLVPIHLHTFDWLYLKIGRVPKNTA